MKYRKITSIILAGGKSSRMGEDKGFVHLKGKYMIQYVIDVARNISDNILIISNNSEYRSFGYTVFSDIIRQCGPLGGIYTGLVHSQTESNLILCCDLPFITENAVKYIIGKSKGYDVTVPVIDGKMEPLCALYQKRCSEKFKESLLRKELKISDVVKTLNTNMVDITSRKNIGIGAFRNINTPSDLLRAEESNNEN